MADTTPPPKPALDLNLAAWEQAHGQILVIGTWSLLDKRPCMVLIPAWFRKRSERIIPCIVPLDHAFMWDEHTGEPGAAARMSVQFASALGFNAFDPATVVSITAIIREHLGDLLTMPPFPASEKKAVADVLMTDINGKTIEAEVIDNV